MAIQNQISAYSTAEVAAHQRIGYWNGLLCDTFTSLEVSPKYQDQFQGELKSTGLADLSLSRVLSSPAKVSHSRSMASHESEHHFLLHMQLRGSSKNRQCGKEALLNAGDFTLCDNTRPYEVAFEDTNEMLVLRITEQQIKHFITTPEDLCCIPMKSSLSKNMATSSVLKGLWDNFDPDMDHNAQKYLANAVLNLLAVSYNGCNITPIASTTTKTSKRSEALRFIDIHLDNPELSPALIADHLSVSVRYLHMLFQDRGETVSQIIQQRRLLEAKNLIEDFRHRGLTISEIAYSLGFNNPTHFGRIFKEKYGHPPKYFRASQNN